MIIKKLSNYLEKNGLPVFWQLFVLLDFTLSVSIIFFENSLSYHLANISILFLTLFGFGYQLIVNHRSMLSWGSLFLGVILIKVSIIIQEIGFFATEINQIIPFSIEQSGIVLISTFGLSVMLLFEKKFRLNGLTTDLSLLILSVTIFTLLVSPEILDEILALDTAQKLLIAKILFASILLIVSIIIHFVLKNIVLQNIIFSISILLVIIHFGIDLFASLDLIDVKPEISASIYHLAGVFILFFAFVEDISLYSESKYSYALGSTLMWISAVAAVSVIPLSILTRWQFDQKSIDTKIIAFSSLLLSSIVIWRLILIIKKYQEQGRNLKQLAYTDPLTLLPNYHGTLEKIESYRLENMLAVAINIDDFRSINDLYGRSFGDNVLISLAQRLKKLPETLIAARVGTDVFIIVYQIANKDIHVLIKDIQKRLGIWDYVSGQRIAVPLTFGVSHSKTPIEPQRLVRQAEEALSFARLKRSNYSIYFKSSNNNLPRCKLREILQKSIDQNYLPVHFQPIYNIENGSLSAMELLIRIESEENGILLPGQFLEQAQAYGLLTPLTKICISMIARNYQSLPRVTININLPSYMLDNAKILDDFLHSFKATELPPERFCIEVLEDQDIPAEHLLQSLKKLKEIGFSIAMDDFGTGYSSLSRLSMLPFDTVKIDRSLLLAASSGNKTILESAITLIKRLDLSAVVEGVETTEQLALIRILGADLAQGFLLSKPVDVNKAKELPLNATNIIAEF